MKIKTLWMGFMVVLTAGTAAAQTTPGYFGAPETTVATISLCGQDSLLLGFPISAGVSEVPLVHLDWKTSCSEYPGWLQVGYDDSGWDGPYFEGCGDGNLIQQALYCGNEDYLIWGRPECDAVFLRLTLSDFKGQLVGMQLGVDDVSTVYINGQEVLGTLTWEICYEIDLTQHLSQDVNVIAVQAIDLGGCQGVFGKFQIERSATWSDGLQSGTRWVSEPGVYTLTVVDGTGVAVYIYEVIGSDLALAGCTDAQACNYVPEAICGDGSCIYPPDGAVDCMVGETFCGPGQTWNPTLQQCIIATSNGGGLCGVGTVWDSGAGVCVPWVACPDLAYNPDVDADGVIGVIDLLGLLVLFDDQDSDGDGIFDSMDDCFGVLDGCGVCGGVGVDLDADGVCDDVDPCVGSVDVVGVCGGACVADADGDGVCDDVDSCVGELDACGVCNGPGAVYSCGCVELEPNACNCDGDVLDALGVCGGACEADADADGLCDDVDPCVGALDECGVCNGPGPSVPILDQVVFVTDSVFIPPLNSWYVFSYPVDTLYTYVCPVQGCTDTQASNFNPLAVIEDGSCTYGPAQCGGQSTVTFDGYTYALVGIGMQCWFKENLRSDHYRNGDAIPGNLSNSSWQNATSGAQAVYNNDASNLATYGRLYNWYATQDSRGLCPTGFHVPSDGEWMTLEMALGMTQEQANGWAFRGTDQGTQMKSSPSDSPSWNGSNTSGFSGLPAGYRDYYGSFSNLGYDGDWWSSSPSGGNAVFRNLSSGDSFVDRSNDLPRYGFSVRCVRD